MRLTEKQARQILERYGCYVLEACDKCGQLLGYLRYTRKGEDGAWCSRECRGDAERPAVRGLVHRKHATLEERLASKRAKAATRQERLRLRKTSLQLAHNQ